MHVTRMIKATGPKKAPRLGSQAIQQLKQTVYLKTLEQSTIFLYTKINERFICTKKYQLIRETVKIIS